MHVVMHVRVAVVCSVEFHYVRLGGAALMSCVTSRDVVFRLIGIVIKFDCLCYDVCYVVMRVHDRLCLSCLCCCRDECLRIVGLIWRCFAVVCCCCRALLWYMRGVHVCGVVVCGCVLLCLFRVMV